MNVLSVLALTLTAPEKPTAAERKQGKPDHSDKIFINKARVNEASVENDEAGMKSLGEAMHESMEELEGRSMYLIGKGQTDPELVANGLIAGEIFAYQYHGPKYDEPSWRINLGFAADVKRKNAGYKSSAGKKARKTPVKAKQPKRGLISS
jgi:hypothetical protein